MLANIALPLAALCLLSANAAFAETKEETRTENATAAEAPVKAPVPDAEKAGGNGEHRSLADMDRNGDGAASPEEAAAFSEEQFTLMDADKDGFVTVEEMDTFHHARKGEWAMKREKERGALPPEVQEQMKAHMEARRKERMADLDPDGDGKIAKADFVAHAKKRHEKMDLNGDGSVTREEVKELHEKKREERKAKMKEKIHGRPEDPGKGQGKEDHPQHKTDDVKPGENMKPEMPKEKAE